MHAHSLERPKAPSREGKEDRAPRIVEGARISPPRTGIIIGNGLHMSGDTKGGQTEIVNKACTNRGHLGRPNGEGH